MTKDANIRADIPAMLCIEQQRHNKRFYESQYRQRWGWRDGQRPKLSLNKVMEFVQTYAWPKETELALQCLFEGDYDVPRAVEIIHEARQQKLRLNREKTERIPHTIFKRAMDRHGKKFHLVKRRLGRNVTTQELVSKFYLWKLTPEYEKWHDGQREKTRKREAKRLVQLYPAADQHREYCEICLKDGKLLCCDGCERAFHLNCVRPALLDVPEGDWFCSHCRDVTSKTSPIIKWYNRSAQAPDAGISKSTPRPKTKANGTSLKGGNVLLSACYAGDTQKETDKNYPATEKCSEKSKFSASGKSEDAPDKCIPEDLDGISDITTESESDSGAAKAIQSYNVTANSIKKRKQKYPKLETVRGRPRYKLPSRSLENQTTSVKGVRENGVPLQRHKYAKMAVGQPRYSSSALSLEYCSSSVKPATKNVVPLQLKSVSSSRKRKHRFGVSRNSRQFLAVAHE